MMSFQLGLSGNIDFTNKLNPLIVFSADHGQRRFNLIKNLILNDGKNIISSQSPQYKSVIENDINILKDGGYLQEVDQKLIPSFFIALADEYNAIFNQVEWVAQGFFTAIKFYLKDLEEDYVNFSFHQKFPWSKTNFLFIGAFLLHLGQKIMLSQGKRPLLTTAPVRKSGTFYIWALENSFYNFNNCYLHYYEHYGDYTVGSFGKRSSNEQSPYLPDQGYALIHGFGFAKAQKLIIKTLKTYESIYFNQNLKITDFHLKKFSLIGSLAETQIPFGLTADRVLLEKIIINYSELIGDIFSYYHKDLLQVFKSYRASYYNSFENFLLWQYDLITFLVMQKLIDEKLLTIPLANYAAYIFKGPPLDVLSLN